MFINKDEIIFEFEGAKFILSDFRRQIMTIPYPSHYHSKNSYEIHYIKEGEGQLITNEKKYDIQKNTLFVTGPYILHGQIPLVSFEKYSIYFNIFPISPSALLNVFLERKLWVGIDKNMCESLFEKIEQELSKKEFGYINNVISFLKLMIVSILRNYNTVLPPKNEKTTYNLIFEIERTFLYEFRTITLEQLANSLYISKRQLERFLNTNYKKNFQTLKMEAKMNYAINQLLFSNSSVSDISNDIGYSSCEHFITVFKKNNMLTPLQYRKKNKKP